MLYHLLTQNLPSNPLSSTQALSAAKENTKSLLEKPFSSGTPRHRKYAYPLPGWPLFPVPHSWYFKPSLLASYPFQGHTWPPFSPYPFCLLWHGGVKGAEWALPNFLPFSSLPNPTLPFSIKDNVFTFIFIDTASPPVAPCLQGSSGPPRLANSFPSAHKHAQPLGSPFSPNAAPFKCTIQGVLRNLHIHVITLTP